MAAEINSAVDALVNELARPIFVYRMARAQLHLKGHTQEALRRSAVTRLHHATSDIEEAVRRYINHA